MKYFIASGDSFTDYDFKSFDPTVNKNWDMWPEVISKQLNIKSINVGRMGSGNVNIINRVLDCLVEHKEQPEFIMIQLTNWDRISLLHCDLIITRFLRFTAIKNITDPSILTDENQKKLDAFRANREISILSHDDDLFEKLSLHIAQHVATWETIANNTLRALHTLINICLYKNIPLFVYAGLGPMLFKPFDILNESGEADIDICLADPNLFCKKVITNTYFKEIDTIHNTPSNIFLMGWPWFKPLGGTVFEVPSNMRCSKGDGHPNGQGQEKLAGVFLEEYKKYVATAKI